MNYTTDQGDTWDIIAFRCYEKEALFPLLIAANPAHAATVIFLAGEELVVPDAPESPPDNLPPWKR